MNSLLRPNIRTLRAYQAKEIPCRVKLDANESPFPFRVRQEVVKKILTNRYPDPEARALRVFFSKKYRVAPGSILFGNGSDELIYYLVTTFGGPVLYPVPTFSMYGIVSQALGRENKGIPLDKTFDIDIKSFLAEIRKWKPHIVFLSSPNNPTGNCFSRRKMIRIIEESGGLVVVDEAYQPFSGQKSFIPLVNEYENLVVLRTLSKIGLAALRVGMMIAGERLVREVNKVRLPFNLNSMSQALAVDAIRDKKKMQSYINSIILERKRLFKEMGRIKGIRPYPSEANFILFGVTETDKVYAGLLKRGVLVRNINDSARGCLRVTVGTKKENNIFLKALKEVLS